MNVTMYVMHFSWLTAPRPIVALAPMAGVTDASYRQLIKKIAPEVIVYTEFLSTDAIHYGARKTMELLSFDPSLERPFIVQVFGKDPHHFLTAAKIVEDLGADGIDINMGCPAAKVVSSCHGSSLIRQPELAAELVHATKKAVNISVSVKTRLGWDTPDTLIPFCQKLVEAGADALAIHGRRYCDKFTGKADWQPIYELKKHVSVPVIGNGDIASAADAVAKIGNLDGVMVGRGTFGNPWVMAEIVDALKRSTVAAVETRDWFDTAHHRPRVTTGGTAIATVAPLSFHDKIPFILEHCALAVRIKGERRGMLEMRRHLSSYVKGFDGASAMRMQLMQVERLADAQAILCG
ncbi:MAG: dihydrouridine synthase tim-barrel nifr3 family protein [Candidatus Peregrinibacteria bacterium Greene0416_19]|nr:MAG: dihydrouridine synthase tim-barrel nifr3 family protein [Candidatus Peregrinibacteria bacterium Greene0416_19]